MSTRGRATALRAGVLCSLLAASGGCAAGGARAVAAEVRPDDGAAAEAGGYGQLVGTYRSGVPVGRRYELELRPDGTFELTIDDAVGPLGRIAGGCEWVDGVLMLSYDRDALDAVAGISLPQLLPVRWGERLYLLRPRQREAFYIAASEGVEPRRTAWGGFFLRVGDEEKPAADFGGGW